MNFIENMGFLQMLVFYFVVVFFCLLPFYLIRLAIVEEATAVCFKRMGRFCYTAIEFDKHYLDTCGNVADGPGRRSYGFVSLGIFRIGGWVFYLYPLIRPANYSDYNLSGDGFGEGVHIRLGDVASNPRTLKAETTEKKVRGGGRPGSAGSVPINVKFTSKMRVVNPYKFLFVSPRDVVREAIEDRQDGVLRAWVNTGDRQHVLSAKSNGIKLWQELQDNGLLDQFDEARDDWGLDVVKNSIIVKDVGFDPAYQQAMEAESEAELNARASVKATTGRVMLAVASELGMSIEELNKKLRDTPAFASTQPCRDALAFAKDMVKRDRAADKGELLDARFGSTDGEKLPDSLQTLAVGGGGMGVLAGGGKKRGKDQGGNSSNRIGDKTPVIEVASTSTDNSAPARPRRRGDDKE